MIYIKFAAETFFEKNGAFLLTLFGVPGGLYAAGNIFGLWSLDMRHQYW
jgi:hypothetical protein